MSPKIDEHLVKDWDRIQEIGLIPLIKTPEDYLLQTAKGAAQAERLLVKANQLVPDAAQLEALHFTMFKDIHPWAGTFRKDGQEVRAGELICSLSTDIRRDLEEITKEMKGNSLEGTKRYKTELLSYYHASLLAVHPFLDGMVASQG